MYCLDDDMIFDPMALTEAVTPSAVQANLRKGKYGMALLMSLHLNEFALVKSVIEDTPYESIATVVRSIGQEHLSQLIQKYSTVHETLPPGHDYSRFLFRCCRALCSAIDAT